MRGWPFLLARRIEAEGGDRGAGAVYESLARARPARAQASLFHLGRNQTAGRAIENISSCSLVVAIALLCDPVDMGSSELDPEIADEIPWSDTITDYDQRHLIVYLRLLDAETAGATKEEMARIVLGIDPVKEPLRASSALDAHLRRARWMTEHGYRQLLKK